jgi:hypothetical protein
MSPHRHLAFNTNENAQQKNGCHSGHSLTYTEVLRSIGWDVEHFLFVHSRQER